MYYTQTSNCKRRIFINHYQVKYSYLILVKYTMVVYLRNGRVNADGSVEVCFGGAHLQSHRIALRDFTRVRAGNVESHHTLFLLEQTIS